MALNKIWKNRPFGPLPGETPAQYEARLVTWAQANPGDYTSLDAVAMMDVETRAQGAILADRETSKTVLTRLADGTVATATDNLGRVTDQIVRGAAGITGFREAGVTRSVVRDANGRIMEVT